MFKVITIGPFPPPVHGMAKNLKLVADTIEKHKEVIRIDISPGSIQRGFPYHFRKIIKVLIGIIKLTFIGITNKDITFYMPPDAGKGMYYSLIFIKIAKIFNMHIFLHHRSFAYINNYNRTMYNLVETAGESATHIFLCDEMSTKFYKLYPISFHSMIVSNAQHVHPIDENQIKVTNKTLVIGHLSNLSIEKGLQDVIDLTKQLITKNYKVELLLAGPIENKTAELILKNAQQELNINLRYLGPIYNADKDNFFREIDIFIFPTRYRNEAQPNVLFEASSYGVPSITLDRGCILSDIDENMGAVIEPDKIFSQEAFNVIKKWLSNDIFLNDLKKSSLREVKQKKEKALVDFNLMIKKISNS